MGIQGTLAPLFLQELCVRNKVEQVEGTVISLDAFASLGNVGLGFFPDLLK